MIGKRAGRPVGQIADRHHRRDLAAERHRLRRDGEKLIQRSTLVRLDVRERNVAKRCHRDDAPDGLAHRSEQHSRAGVEQQRIGIANQVLVEGEAARDDAGRDGRADPEDPVCNLVDRVEEEWPFVLMTFPFEVGVG